MIYDIHQIAKIFPVMSESEFIPLKQDIAKNGLLEPIWLYEDKVLDGRHRYSACQETGIAPRFRVYDGNDPIGFVVSLNLKRRHLNESQRAMVAASLANMPAHRPSDKSANLQTSQTQAADMLQVSTRSVATAAKIERDATQELVDAVRAGSISLNLAAQVAELPKEQQKEIVARGEKEILQAAKKIRNEKADAVRNTRLNTIAKISQENKPLEGIGRFPVIYCDPPWRYEYIETESRAIENQYPTMSLEEICALSINEIALDDCVLFMWATSPKLEEAFKVLAAWGFAYRTCAIWDKEVIGMGYYFRQQHELLLVATRGNVPAPPPTARVSSILRVKREQHSKKPQAMAEIIEAMYPTLPKVEMFCRNKRDGWSVWGNQSV